MRKTTGALPTRRLALILAGGADVSLADARAWLLGRPCAREKAERLTHTAAHLELTARELGPRCRLYARPAESDTGSKAR